MSRLLLKINGVDHLYAASCILGQFWGVAGAQVDTGR